MRATYLQFRNPKEGTPLATYYTFKDNYGLPLNRFEYMGQSESRKGTFSQDNRFETDSIYHNLGQRTNKTVGPGTYKDDEAVKELKKKPCMSSFLKPLIGPHEGPFEIHGHQRLFQASYLPKPSKNQYYNMLEKYKRGLSRKVNETLVFHESLGKAHNRSKSGLRRNLNFEPNMTPEF